MWGRIETLAAHGVMGINRRNADYILRYNPRRLYPLVDDKLITKRLAAEAGIPVPTLYQVVELYGQVKGLPARLEPYPEFVIKPTRGSQGKGIWVIAGQRNHRFRKVNGHLVDPDELRYHVTNILSGVYSLGGQPDQAMIEYRVQFDPLFNDISYLGAPDIRLIVFLGVPVMAMLRLPTGASDGKANLHQGAIGVGLDLDSGTTLFAIQYDQLIDDHPDTGHPLRGLQLPHWEQFLHLAARCYEFTGLGFLGVDFVLDGKKGPMLLEINARPGLSIQIANQEGLLKRINLVERYQDDLHTAEERCAFAQSNFGVGL